MLHPIPRHWKPTTTAPCAINLQLNSVRSAVAAVTVLQSARESTLLLTISSANSSSPDLLAQPQHKRAIFFPESEINPRIVWLKCTADSMGDVYYEWIDVSPYLGHKRSGKFYAPRKNYHVSLIARDDFLSDGSSINKSIIATAGPSMARSLTFRGPMVAIREVDYDTYCDITLANFWCLSQYLRCYGVTASAKPATSPCTSIHAAKASRGVKIRRQGGDIPQRSDVFVPVDITANTMLASFGEGILSPVSVRLGMPIRIWKYPNAKDYAGAFNPDALSLLREIDPIHPLFGHPHPYWDSGIEDVLAVREDGQDLSVQDVRVMCGFGAILYCDLVVNVMAGNNMAGKRRISESVTCENMAKRWREGDDCMYAE